MHPKTASIVAITFGLILFVVGPAVFVYIIDPFQIYHSSFFKEAKYSKEQAYQHVGWINRLLADPKNNYQNIVIGSSTMANYTQALINEYLPWGNTLNLSINGSTPQMQHSVAEHAIKKNPHLKNILWDVHFFYLFDPESKHSERTEFKFPYYLYNETIFDDGPYIFNISNLITGLSFLTGDFIDFSYGIEDNGPIYKELLGEGRFDKYSSKENRLKTLLPMITSIGRFVPEKSYYENHKFNSLDHSMLDLLLPLCNTQINIDIIFSPYTRHYYASLDDRNYLTNEILLRRYLVDKTKGCSNISVYAFDNVDKIVTNLSYYADSFHYSPEVNRYVLASIANHKDQLTPANIDEYETLFIKNINAYKAIFMDELDKL